MDDVTCIPGETECFQGRGVCNEASQLCECSSAYVRIGDFARATECSVYIPGRNALLSLIVINWGLVFVGGIYGIVIMKRKEHRQEVTEKLVLLFNVISSTGYIVSGILAMNSVPYGARSIGNDLITTVFYCYAMVGTWLFHLYKPLVSLSGISSSVFSYAGTGKFIYSRLAPLLAIGTTIGSVLPIVLLDRSKSNALIVSATYLDFACVGTLLVIYIAFALVRVRANITKALRTNREVQSNPLDSNQLERLRRYLRRATFWLSIAFLSSLWTVITFFVFAFDWNLARDYSWIAINLCSFFTGGWCVRHVKNNILLSRMYRRREIQSSVYGTGDDNGTFDNDQEAEDDTFPARAMRSVSPFSSGRRVRRLRGVKRKPLEVMSAVTERTGEGTVLFTHVDGLNVEDESSEARPRRLSTVNTTNSDAVVISSTKSQ